MVQDNYFFLSKAQFRTLIWPRRLFGTEEYVVKFITYLLRNVCITDHVLDFGQILSAYPSTSTTLGKKIEGFWECLLFCKIKNICHLKIIPDII